MTRSGTRSPLVRATLVMASLGSVGCYQSHGLPRGDAGPHDSGVIGCACPCDRPELGCHGAPDTVVTLRAFEGGLATLHRVTSVPIAITFDPSLDTADDVVAAIEAWQRECPGTLSIGSVRPELVHERVICGSQLHLGLGVVGELNCGRDPSPLFGDRAGRLTDACVVWDRSEGRAALLQRVGHALGFAPLPPGTGRSVMEPAETRAEDLTDLDREGFCAAYAGGGFCGE